MAPFLVNHPVLLHNWMLAREQALARVLALPEAAADSKIMFAQNLARVQQGVSEWHTDNQRQAARVVELIHDLEKLTAVAKDLLEHSFPWQALYDWAEQQLTVEGQELLVTLIIEPHGELVDDLAEQMAADEEPFFVIDGAMTVAKLRQLIEQHYQWALAIDFKQTEQQARFWYVSEEKLEPRLGERFREPGAELEQRLGFAHDVAALYTDLATISSDATVAALLLRYPQHRHACRRVQTLSRLPYADIRDNLLSASMLPIDLLRCKLSFFGATKFDPRSDRWVRITMYQDAPFPDELSTMPADDWSYPPLQETG